MNIYNIFSRTQRRLAKQQRHIAELKQNNDRCIAIHYPKNIQSELARLCEVHGSDKSAPHSYTDFYEMLFEQKRDSIKFVFECGIGRNNADQPKIKGGNGYPGASLRVWRDYFHNAKIVGADILENVLFTEDRIVTVQIDQTDKLSIVAFLIAWRKKGNYPFDVIIDDGLHTFDAGKILFENMIGMLADDGVYIIEDISHGRRRRFNEYFQTKTNQYKVRFISFADVKSPIASHSLLMITRNLTKEIKNA